MDAIYQIVKKSNGITKDGCFKHIVGLLGYSRMSERAIEILEEALVFLKARWKNHRKAGLLVYLILIEITKRISRRM